MGAQPETAACVRDAEKKKTRCASCSPQVQEPRAGAQPETAACVRDAEKKKTRCASCSPQVQEPRAGAQPETAACVRDAGKKKTRCASCSPQVCPPQARGVCRAFSSYLSPFPVWLFASQTSFHLSLRPRREFPRLSSPVALFPARGSCHLLLFRGLLRPLPVCLPCALFWLFVHLSVLFARVFSLVFHPFLLTSSSQTSFHLSLRPRRASTFFRKESRQRFARGAAPSNPHSCALRPISPFPALLAGLTALRAANRRLTGKRLKSQGAELSFSSVSVRGGRAGAFSPPGKTGAARRRAAGNSRVRARRGEEKDTVRVLLTAGAGAVRGRAAGKNRGRARLGRRQKTRCASCSPQVCPPQARGCAGLFPLIFRLFLFGFLPLKILFTCRSGRDGDFLACSLPRLCSRPAGSCHLLLFRGLLRPVPVFPFCVVYAGFLSLVFLPFPA